jgi:(2Fe-2S) ferredoxin
VKSLEDLERIRREARERLAVRASSHQTVVAVGMGTCGIAAGGREVVSAFMDELSMRKISNVAVTQTGCPGLCEYEPMVTVSTPGAPKVTYTYVTPEKARQIVAQHIVNGRPITEWTLAR